MSMIQTKGSHTGSVSPGLRGQPDHLLAAAVVGAAAARSAAPSLRAPITAWVSPGTVPEPNFGESDAARHHQQDADANES